MPNIFIHSRHLGGCDSLVKANGNGTLDKMLNNEEVSDKPNYDYGMFYNILIFNRPFNNGIRFSN